MSTIYRPFSVRLTRRRQVSPSFVRITLSGDELRYCAPTLLDQRVKLLVGEGIDELVIDDWYQVWAALPNEGRPVMRTYTLSAVRPEHDEVDIDVVVHADEGPVGAYAVGAPLGARCLLIAADVRHEGHDQAGVAWRPGDAREVLIVADETALPAVVNILATLAADTTGRVVVEVPEPEDARDLDAPDGVRIVWCAKSKGERAADAAGFGTTLVDDPDDLPVWQEASGGAWYGWVAGEASMVRGLRASARTAGVDPQRIAFMGYWKAGTPG